jgi:hypothetical protein
LLVDEEDPGQNRNAAAAAIEIRELRESAIIAAAATTAITSTYR